MVRAEMIREKGTNRSQFFRGQVDKYTWMDIGSSYLPGEIVAAFLWAQMEEAESITQRRLDIWNEYHKTFEPLELTGRVRRPTISSDCIHNAHMYYLIMHDLEDRTRFINAMQVEGVNCVFHYVPLHSAPHGRVSGRSDLALLTTDDLSDRLVRLPLWIGLMPAMTSLLSIIMRQLSSR